MKFSELANLCRGTIIQIPLDITIKDLAYDTRQLSIQSGILFFAIKGAHHDGHSFLQEAYQKGVRLFVTEQPISIPNDASAIQVQSGIQAMQAIAAYRRAQHSIPVIGVTGSNGKTIVKEWLTQLLSDQFDILKSPKSYNSQLGVPLSVWPISSHHNLCIFEAGISEKVEMSLLENIIKPTIGIFTNLGEAHNAGFKSLEEKASEKALLFKNVKRVIYCEDYELVKEALIKNISDKKALIGWKVTQRKGKRITLSVRGNEFTFQLKFEDTASIENALHCSVAMIVLGFDQAFIQLRLNRLSSVKMRLEMKQAINRSYVIDDTYNNDLYGLEVALEFLNRQNQRPKKTVILSDLYQTGLSQSVLYARVNELLQNNKINRFIGIGPDISQSKQSFHIPSTFYKSTETYLASDSTLTEEVILVKGSRNFEFEKIVHKLEQKSHGTVLEVNLENLIYNFNFYRNQLPDQTKIMVMVKALAYGGGNFEIAHLLQFHKVDYLGVAYIDEAVDLRKNGIHVPIMIMNVSPESFRLLKEYNLEPEIYSLDQLIDYIDYFDEDDSPPGIHIKLETGMNRLGFRDQALNRLNEQLQLNKKIKVKSVFSHLAGSEDLRHSEFTKKQIERFDDMSETIISNLWYKPMKHLVNTGGITNYPQAHYDMVRLGIGIHGFEPTQSQQERLKIVSQLKCPISQVKKIPAGESIGYGRSGFAKQDTTIAIIPIGYADGYIRAFGNGKGKMLVNNKLVNTIGNICMDMCMIDVTGIAVKQGDEVTVFGEKPSISELAEWIDTIPYEILTNVSQRVKRIFLSE